MSSQKQAADALKPGDHVEWKAPVPGGKTEGEVVVSCIYASFDVSSWLGGCASSPSMRHAHCTTAWAPEACYHIGTAHEVAE